MAKTVEFEIRKAVPEDAHDIVEHFNVVAKESNFTNIDPTVGFWMTAEEEAKLIKDWEENKGGVFLVAREKGTNILIGEATATRQPRTFSHVFELGIAVKKAFWGCGAGRALLDAVTEEAIEIGAEKLELEVFTHNTRAIKMYEKAGFVREGLKRKSVKMGDEYYEDVYMGKILKVQSYSDDVQNETETVPATRKPFDFKIVPARVEDAKDLVDYCSDIAKETDCTTIDPVKGFWMTVEEEEEEIREKNESGNGVFLVAKERESGQIIGSATAFRLPRERSYIFDLGVSVKKAFWRGGVGKALFKATIDKAIELGAEKLQLGVYAHNARAVAMYERFGFRREVRMRMAVKTYAGHYHDMIYMAYYPDERSWR